MTFNDDDVVRELEAAREHETEPPPGFVATIMRGVSAAHARLPFWRRWTRARRAANLSRTHRVVPGVRIQSEVRRPTAAFAREGIVAKKALWALAGFGGIAIIVALFVGVPSLHSGTEATIGAAKRYSAPSSGSASVPLGDMTAQQFLQSDTFDRLMKDPNTRGVLQMAAHDAAFRSELTSPDLRELLATSAAMREGLADPNLSKALADPDLQKAMRDQALKEALVNSEFRTFLANPALHAEFASADFRMSLERLAHSKAMADPAVQSALREANFERALQSKAIQQAMAKDAEFSAALKAADLKQALASPAVREALASPSLREMLMNKSLQQDLSVPAVQAALASAAFGKALAEPALISMLSRQEFASALAQLGLLQKSLHAASLEAALAKPELIAAIAAPAMHAALMSAEFQKEFASR